MLSAIAIVPSAPVVVPELAGAAAADLVDLVAAASAAVADLPEHWVIVGTGSAEQQMGPDTAGTFAGFGVDLPVRLAPDVANPAEPEDLPLSVLIGAWLRGRNRPQASAEALVWPVDGECADAVAAGRRLRADLDARPAPVGVLVVADGINSLNPSAPGGYQPELIEVQQSLDDALARGDVGALAELPTPVRGRIAFAVLAGLAGAGPRTARELYRGAPLGVGYFVGVWQP